MINLNYWDQVILVSNVPQNLRKWGIITSEISHNREDLFRKLFHLFHKTLLEDNCCRDKTAGFYIGEYFEIRKKIIFILQADRFLVH